MKMRRYRTSRGFTLLEVITNNKVVLSPWSTLVIRVVEKDDPTRTNELQAFLQVPSVYPQGAIKWTFSNFLPIVWDQVWPSAESLSETKISDSTFTSENYSSDPTRPEIAVHGFYDSSSEDSQIFADFATIIEGLGGAGSQW